MGLAEKRAIEGFKTSDFAQFQTQIKEITKFDLPIEVAWDKFAPAIEGYSDATATLKDFFSNLYAKPLVQALTAVCADDMGREALQSALKKLVLTTGPDGSPSGSGFKFDNGTLTMNMRYANTDQVNDRATAMQKLLESKL